MTVRKFRLTLAAAADVRAIFVESVRQFGSEQAARYRDGLRSTFEFLADFPRSARIRDELPRNVRVHRYRSHVIIYRVQEDGTVLIVRVRHGRQDWQSDITQ